jgi:hypothetical protein
MKCVMNFLDIAKNNNYDKGKILYQKIFIFLQIHDNIIRK